MKNQTHTPAPVGASPSLTRYESILKFLNESGLKIDFPYYLSENDVEDVQTIEDALQDNGAFDVEIIYYSNAIDYLRSHDPSLKDSLNLALDLGYGIDNLSSETLASLLASVTLRNDWHDLRNDLERFITDLDDDLED